MGEACITGVGSTGHSRDSGRSPTVLAVQAVRAALADAGLTAAQVDGIVTFAAEPPAATAVASALGAGPLSFVAADAAGSGSAAGVLGLARLAVSSGRARVVVAYRALNGSSGRRFGRPDPAGVSADGAHTRARGRSAIGGEFSGPYGLLVPAHVFALMAEAWLARHGNREELEAGLRAVAVRQRSFAARTPGALLAREPLSAADHRRSPSVAGPLRRADLCLESDGACAVIVTAADVVTAASPVRIAAAAQWADAGYEHLFLRGPLPPRPPDGAVADLLAAEGLTVDDLDLLGTHDSTSFNVILDAESVGLCPPGGGARWAADPNVACNPSGGMLAEAYVQGMNTLVELVRQLRGTAGNQQPGCRTALLTGPAVNSAALLIGTGKPS
jgi:acetyl-CoA acetyltransferase